MDFPSASTFGLLRSRRTAISLPVEVVVEYARDEDLEPIGLDELAELDGEDGGEVFEIIFEPWDENMHAYVIGELLDDDDGDGADDDDDDEEEDQDDDGNLLC